MEQKKDQKALTPRSENQSEWYTEVVTRAKMADYSPVRGSMVIMPYGYAIWEKIQEVLGKMIKDAGVKNAYFPLLIPLSFLHKEAEHVEGFAPEVAIVTHAGDKELEEKLVIRPTSETIIYSKFAEWIQSYRDLPLKINQWCNVVRWEKRTTPFLRTSEFLWQEGHTAHATKEEANIEVMRALNMYYDFIEENLAMYGVKGYKTEAEKFAGAQYTTTIEALMRDGKALQSGTSHLLGQSFAKSFDVNFLDQNGQEQYAWTTSWGLSTRIIGGLIMMHGDDKGLVFPPKIAPVQAIIVPIYKSDNQAEVMDFVATVEKQLAIAGIRFETDDSDNSPGFKFADAELRGIPVRLEIGPKDVAENAVMAVKRVDGTKQSMKVDGLVTELPALLDAIQTQMLARAKQFTQDNTNSVSSYDEFKQVAESKIGFIEAYFCGDKELEKKIQEETKYTSRCVPLETFEKEGKCFITGETGKLTLFAKAY
jgi:prolyl-tRNA synthetase